jgi:hypothetical protein
MAASEAAWRTWFGSWYASHWTPADLPALRVLVRLFDQVERGEFQRASELRMWLDTWGISPKGAQDRRWLPPDDEGPPPPAPAKPQKFRHLQVIDHTG